jgi:mono/diheme cytochrome c family protein
MNPRSGKFRERVEKMLLLVALFTGSLAQAPVAAPAGDPAAGKALWNEPQRWCKRCHGENADGGFGPDLAGRGLSVDQVKRALRQPWAIMPAHTEMQVTERRLPTSRRIRVAAEVAEPSPPAL